MSEGMVQIILAIIGTGVVMEAARYLLGGRRQGNLDVMMTELQRLDNRVDHLEKKVERYEIRDAIYTNATSCAHKCQKPDEECPVLAYLERNPLPEKSV